mmetsp:Transcript_21849/g.37323  ORF Transcript_21849/g.37323 Transcript_21849/m.37323 type:complete len:216 (-) Transcript_21849:1467-2114(-)
MYALASFNTGAPVISPGIVSNPANLSSPGAKERARLRMIMRSCFSGTVLITNWLPTCMRGCMARSFFTATVKPGGSKLACDTQLANMAADASSSMAVTTASDPTMRPAASWAVLPTAAAYTPGAAAACLARLRRLTANARSLPLSSHAIRSLEVGLNLTRTAGNAKPKPASLSRFSSWSTASPLHPKEPNTPHGSALASCCRITAPSATVTWVGM